MYYFEEDHSLSQKAEDMIKLADTGGGISTKWRYPFTGTRVS